MSLFNRQVLLTILCQLLLASSIVAQDCNITLKGLIIDHHDGGPLDDVHLLVEGLDHVLVTDSEGRFEWRDVCRGHYHFLLSHVGCDHERYHLELTSDTTLTWYMHHSDRQLEALIVRERDAEDLAPRQVIRQQAIEDASSKSIAEHLEEVPGVRILRLGQGISKPIVHGLYGARLLMLNHGVPLRGQQWGNGHAPEIDPRSADRIEVIKGTAAVAHQGANLGSVIKVEANPMSLDPHLHGHVGYHYRTNGRGHGLFGRLEQRHDKFAWRVQFSGRTNGDYHTPDYFMKNTGTTELNGSLLLAYDISEGEQVQLYVSTFNTELGVLRGSHISNLSDLESALSREVPFFTEEDFGRDIGSPRQQVGHHLAKVSWRKLWSDGRRLTAMTAFQINDRQEFDVRRGGRSDRAAMKLQKWSSVSELTYRQPILSDWELQAGLQATIVDNENDASTGILPLIPDFEQVEGGWYALLTRQREQDALQFGLRYDYIDRRAVVISQTIPRELLRLDDRFHLLTASTSYTKDWSRRQTTSLHIGMSQRAPSINEQHAYGLHQGVSGIEQGDPNIAKELAIKASWSQTYTAERWSLTSQLWYQRAWDFIYLQPQQERVLTIRGAFPLFTYEQADAALWGWDAQLEVALKTWLSAHASYTYTHGQNLDEDLPLVGIAPGHIRTGLSYDLARPVRLGSLQIDEVDCGIAYSHTWRQGRLELEQDFVPPPEGYGLVGAHVAGDVHIGSLRIRTTLSGENILDVAYRDYLDRQRYFTDAMGRQFVAQLALHF